MEVAHIDGWVIVVPWGLYHIGQMVVFVEIDAFLPDSVAPFKDMDVMALNATTYNDIRGYHVKTQSFNRQLSQGLIFPLRRVPAVYDIICALVSSLDSWADVACVVQTFHFAKILGVQKWERKPEPRQALGNVPEYLGGLPAFITETSATRVQNCPNLFAKAKYWKKIYQESIKMDGESMAVYFVRKDSVNYRSCNPLPDNPSSHVDHELGRFGVCSHKKELNETAKSKHWEVALRYDLPAKLACLGKNIAIQGELCGSSIGGNREKFPPGSHDFFVFDVFDLDKRQYGNPKSAVEVAKSLGLKHVPVRGYHKIRAIASSHEDLYKRARESNREGYVYKCVQDGRRFKVINDDWLLKHGE